MESKKYCPHCGGEVPVGTSVCPHCGEELVPRKYCPHCGDRIDADCVVCPKCGKQVSFFSGNQPPINIVNNVVAQAQANAVSMPAPVLGKRCNKWTSFFLCLFLGYFGAHKFYEGKPLMGILYIFTVGLFFIGWIIDLIAILGKPNPYYVR